VTESNIPGCLEGDRVIEPGRKYVKANLISAIITLVFFL